MTQCPNCGTHRTEEHPYRQAAQPAASAPIKVVKSRAGLKSLMAGIFVAFLTLAVVIVAFAIVFSWAWKVGCFIDHYAFFDAISTNGPGPAAAAIWFAGLFAIVLPLIMGGIAVCASWDSREWVSR
jgi:hypothetical protein